MRQYYKKGGKTKKSKSRVNEAGNYTKPTMRKRLFNKIKAGEKVASRGSGLPARHKCLLNSTRRLAVGIKTDGRTNGSAKAQNDC